jgi:hypothetical protein
MAEQLPVFLAGGELFPEFGGVFRAHAEGRAARKTEDAVAGCIAKQRRAHVVERRVLAAKGAHRLDSIRVGLVRLEHHGVEQQRDPRLVGHFFEQDRVEDQRVTFGVAVQVLHEDFVDHAALARPAVVVAHVRGRTQNPQPDLAGRVAAQHRAILDQRDAQPGACGGDRAGGPGHAAPHDHEITGDSLSQRRALVSRRIGSHDRSL